MAGILLTLIDYSPTVVAGLTIFCCGVFVAQAASNSYLGIAASHGRATAVGLYVTAYYLGGTFGGSVPGYFWKNGGWPACVALIAFVQIITILFVSRYWQNRADEIPRMDAATD